MTPAAPEPAPAPVPQPLTPLADLPDARSSDELVLDALLDSSVSTIVCCGAGGVGKTTTAAAVALRAAERGRHVVVLTIDPARRLAQAMGLGELDNTPRPVTDIDTTRGGSLAAMMLDMKRTFDEVVLSQADPAKARAILDNPFYASLSSSFAGTQEYMAMEKLGQLRASAAEQGIDLIVVDTPPSRSALDFLDAPQRLGSFLDGRFIRLLATPARGYLRVVSAGVSAVTGVFAKVLGGQVVRDVRTFIAAFDTLFGGFRARAAQTYALLQGADTAFLVVATPEPDALREAGFFVDRLREESMPLAGVVVNRTVEAVAGIPGAGQLATADAERPEVGGLGAGLLALLADREREVARQRHLVRGFSAARPGVRLGRAPLLPDDVHDLAGLREVANLLATGTGGRFP